MIFLGFEFGSIISFEIESTKTRKRLLIYLPGPKKLKFWRV